MHKFTNKQYRCSVVHSLFFGTKMKFIRP